MSIGEAERAQADELLASGQVTWDSLRQAVNRLCEKRGWHFGIPLPSLGQQFDRPLVIARGVPQAEHMMRTQAEFAATAPREPSLHVCRSEDVCEDIQEGGHWSVPGHSLMVYRQRGKSKLLREVHASTRLRLLVASVATRMLVGCSDFPGACEHRPPCSHCVIGINLLGRFILLNGRGLGWNGSEWVARDDTVQISNFDSYEAAARYAQDLGFEVIQGCPEACPECGHLCVGIRDHLEETRAYQSPETEFHGCPNRHRWVVPEPGAI